MDFHCYLPDPWPILSFKTIEDLPISQFGIQLQQADHYKNQTMCIFGGASRLYRRAVSLKALLKEREHSASPRLTGEGLLACLLFQSFGKKVEK
jgi:hypothetical protein